MPFIMTIRNKFSNKILASSKSSVMNLLYSSKITMGIATLKVRLLNTMG